MLTFSKKDCWSVAKSTDAFHSSPLTTNVTGYMSGSSRPFLFSQINQSAFKFVKLNGRIKEDNRKAIRIRFKSATRLTL